MVTGYQGVSYAPIITYPTNMISDVSPTQRVRIPTKSDCMLDALCSMPESAVIINPAHDALETRKRARAMAPNKFEFDLTMAVHDRKMARHGQLF